MVTKNWVGRDFVALEDALVGAPKSIRKVYVRVLELMNNQGEEFEKNMDILIQYISNPS